ncbi:helix-turn-helix transcriptional regulator [Paenarthrobacter ureafaciens]|jgi:AraC-like DNA-binding protein|uniref:helix-turn-helix transcriptional regulator n=1 Tax=Paenarthrobacter sp. PAE-2 TaxID=2982532 RepID=UPI0022300688|nr:helix-turn-helix transcriptional regulator [Paenarthrobacter sp. PAE-2]MCW3767748.1 helix-turn-helix transcriptional regulator [Paenarthrobacter sp. PAE-2]
MEESFKGILYPARLPTFHRLPAPYAVAHLVQWFWIPEWDLGPGRTSRQHIIAYPNCNLVVEQESVVLSGPTTRAGHQDLTGRGWAVGALLRPAATPFFAPEPARITDVQQAFPAGGLQSAVTAAMGTRSGKTHDDGGHRELAVQAFAEWLASFADTPLTEEALLANSLMDVIAADPPFTRIDEVASALAVSPRTLQRVARKYIGLTPAVLIRRRRLQEAAELARTDSSADLAAIAAELGYADHAHLSNEFQRYLGFTPSSYRRALGEGGQ